MSEVIEVDSFYMLAEEIKDIVAKLNDVHRRIDLRLRENSEWDSTYQVSLIQDSLNIRKTAKTLCDDLLNNRLSEPSVAVSHIWHIIELHSSSPETVVEGTHILERFLKLKMRSMIKPTNYLQTITAYVQWQNETVRCFVEQFKGKPTTDRLNYLERLWNWNFRAKETIFLGGAARPLHLKKVTDFSGLMSVYYDTLWPLYKENRNSLVEALYTLLHQESEIYWPNYDIFPCTSSNTILDKCLQYFFFKDRQNTWFINSSASDYIPFVSSAREIFADKFDGSDMCVPDQHNTKWILDNLKRRCLKIFNKQKEATIIILLTSKNRFGHRIDVDYIHTELKRYFSDSNIVTIVDGCQDGQSFNEVDIVIYTKRFTTTGAIGLVNKMLFSKNSLLHKKLTVGANFPIGILAQVYINVNMANTGLAHGIEDLVNSAWWRFWQCPIEHELRSTFYSPNTHRLTTEYSDEQMQHQLHPTFDNQNIRCTISEYNTESIRYSFTEDHIGTILMLNTKDDGQVILPKLWALLKKQGHSLDCFVMDNPYLESNNAIHSDQIRHLIAEKFIYRLREIEVLSSDYLAWPLVPYCVSSPDDISTEELNTHFNTCYSYHCCLRISVGRCGYPGKLKRFVGIIDEIFRTNQLNVNDDFLGKHSSQWPS